MKTVKYEFALLNCCSTCPYLNRHIINTVNLFSSQTFILINQESIKTVIPGPQNPEVHSKGLQADLQDEKDKPWKPLTAEPPLAKDFSPKHTPGDTKQVVCKQTINSKASHTSFRFNLAVLCSLCC